MIFCDDYTSMLGVYTDVLFAEDRGLSPCLGGRDISTAMVIAFYQTTVWINQ